MFHMIEGEYAVYYTAIFDAGYHLSPTVRRLHEACDCPFRAATDVTEGSALEPSLMALGQLCLLGFGGFEPSGMIVVQARDQTEYLAGAMLVGCMSSERCPAKCWYDRQGRLPIEWPQAGAVAR
ncbi:MAG: hypothetical protein Q4G22_11035 [Paracoccus sp. (in: a-proteobacteria)]|uniref:hypothetical protein n=1 Tax=Paracoccus sp. TaxID=267 RepID=UPI0026DF0917|nr:hypothetical protein [Paracoccus sp. (in: a-proteobacteria)]MDO5632360.1 hypothetical protein [Paracoccus sp. (in: a-proteobacteria)]